MGAKKKIQATFEVQHPYRRAVYIGTMNNIPFLSIAGSGRVSGTRVFLKKDQINVIIDALTEMRDSDTVVELPPGPLTCARLIGECCYCRKCGSYNDQKQKKWEKAGRASEKCEERGCYGQIMPVGHKHGCRDCADGRKKHAFRSFGCPLDQVKT